MLPASSEPPKSLTATFAERFVRVALANVGTEYPYHLVHLLRSDADAAPPRALHPAFYGSYDWHSCVHMHWTLARCLRRFPSLPSADAISAHFDARLTPAHIAREIAYFDAPGRASFERPYGWGWLLALQSELARLACSETRAERWRDALAPFAAHLAQRFVDWLPRLDYPVRAGAHTNSAFALVLADRYAQSQQHPALRSAIGERALAWFAADRRYPAEYEPGGDDFLSGGLCEAALMLRTADYFGPSTTLRTGPSTSLRTGFSDWWQAFEPAPAALARWLRPARVSDASDPKIVHLHGLNLSRAWCWRLLAPHLPAPLRPEIDSAVAALLASSLSAATDGLYVGTHWLASFAVLALDTRD
jgi:hypothetical protein